MREMKVWKLSPLEPTPVPVHFRCPISLELMRDPVTISTGHTYDRTSIQHWLACSKTCPVTRLPLPDATLIPNHTLRRLILDWVAAHPFHGHHHASLMVPQPEDPSLLTSLVRTISDSGADSAALSSSLRRLRLLALNSDKNRSLPSQYPKLRSALVSLFFSDDSVVNSDIMSDTVVLMALFPPSDSDSLEISSRPDRLIRISESLRHPSPEIRVNATVLVENLAVISPESRFSLGETPGLIAGIVELLRSPTSPHPRAARAGVKALLALCLARPNRERAAAEGAAAVLVDLLSSGAVDRPDTERALAALELICRTRTGCESLAPEHALAVTLLTKVVLRVSDRATESATGVLLALCRASEARQKEAVGAGAVTQMLLLVQSDCTQRAKRKAQLLLKLLWSACPDQPAPDSDLELSDVMPF